MSFFGWALLFVGLGLAALVLYGWLGWRLWRRGVALGREAGAAARRLSIDAVRTGARGGAHGEM